MTKIPKAVDINLAPSLERISQGKVRDTHLLPGYKDLLFMIATDRVSIFDRILPQLVPGKGIELTKQTVFWLTNILKDLPNHLVAYGEGIDRYLPEDLRNNPDLQARGLVVKKLKMVPIESIVRGYLTGSGLTSYRENGMVCGHILEKGLHDGSRLPHPIYTPTTKAEIGHDEHIDYQTVRAQYGTHQELFALTVFYRLSEYALSRHIILADSKFEFGYDDGILTLADETGTGDSSREWLLKEWLEAQKENKAPGGYDKEPLRQWGKKIGIHKFNDEEYEKILPTLSIPEEEIKGTIFRYKKLSDMLMSQKFE